MSADLLSPAEAADELRRLSSAATGAVQAPPDLAERLLARGHRRRRLRRVAGGIGLALAVVASAAAATLGTSDYFTVTQPSGAMEPTVLVGERVVFSKVVQPVHGDVVLVDWSDQTVGEGISRVIGVEGDVVSCPASSPGRCDAVLVNGQPVSDPYFARLRTRPFPRTVVPDASLFLLGDNRLNAKDSRQLGPVSVDAIEGVGVEIIDRSDGSRPVPGAPARPGPGDDQLIDPPERVPPAQTAEPDAG